MKYDCNHDCDALYEAYENGKRDAIKGFSKWLEDMGYLHEVKVSYDYKNDPQEYVEELDKDKVVRQYLGV